MVAPRVGAWIETYKSVAFSLLRLVSPLAWGRGLKLRNWSELFVIVLSPLAWGRGLKLALKYSKAKKIKRRPSRGGVD